MTVEITGTWLENTGARQMLQAAVQRLREADPDVCIAVHPRWRGSSFRRELGVRSIAPRGVPRTLAPRLVVRSEVGALLDCSGFALSDQWGAKKASQRWETVRRYRERGCPIVLAPQAMGPFADAATARVAREVLEAADLVWARDEQSYEHAMSIAGPDASIRMAPDLTLGLAGEPPDTEVADVVLVPNERLVDRGGRSRTSYVRTLVDAGAVARTAGCSVEVMVHTDEPGDADLATSVAGALKCSLIQEQSPARVKGRLGRAQLVVASRFHALLGALSAGVPALGLGWSHKYGELYRDFDCADLATEDDDQVPALVRDVLRDASDIRRRIAARLPTLHRAVEEMWTVSLPVLGVSTAVAA